FARRNVAAVVGSKQTTADAREAAGQRRIGPAMSTQVQNEATSTPAPRPVRFRHRLVRLLRMLCITWCVLIGLFWLFSLRWQARISVHETLARIIHVAEAAVWA